jgi:predicted DNA-binding WGR domain protein
MSRRRFEFVGGSSSKFWEVAVDGSAVTVRFGRIGTSGQTQQKLFADAATAARTSERLVREKLAKGYVEKTDACGS